MAVNDDLMQWAMTQEQRVNVFAGRIAGDIDRVMRSEVFPDIANRIGDVAWQKLDNNQVRLFQLRQIVNQGLPIDRMRDEFISGLVNMGVEDARNFIETMQQLLPVSVQLTTPSPEQMIALVTEQPFNGQLMGDWFGKYGEATQNQIAQTFRVGIIEGKTIPQMGDELSRVSDAFSGMAKKIKRNTAAVARTATTLVNSRARELAYAENDDVIKGVEYVATLDDRTTAVCTSLDGKVYPIGEGPRPPMHWNCRSTTVPVVKSWEELGIPANEAPPSTRASLNGEVAESTNAEKWLKGRGEATQNDVLGVTRGKLFRGGVPMSDMLEPSGKLRTLRDLRSRGYDVGRIAGDAQEAS